MSMRHEDVFRILALGDLDPTSRSWSKLRAAVEPLDARSQAVASIGALIGLGGCGASMEVAVDTAISAGVTADELISVLVSLGPLVGSARLVEAAPAIGLGLGLDLDRLLEAE